MQLPGNTLITIRQIFKFYEHCLEGVRTKYQLSSLEIKIISFLYHNPGHDTVGEIAELRMLSKGNVSTAADSLIQKGLLVRQPDKRDRRWVHLLLRSSAAPIVEEIEAAGKVFCQQAFAGFTPEDWERYEQLNSLLAQNIRNSLERGS